jgi:hypothetical protein
MTLKKVCACSKCGAERREANHWFVFTRTGQGLEFHKWEWAGREELEELMDASQFGHLCGQQCAHALLDQFLNERKTTE